MQLGLFYQLSRNYEEVEKGKTSLMVAQQEQLVAVKREETQKIQAKIQAVCALIASLSRSALFNP